MVSVKKLLYTLNLKNYYMYMLPLCQCVCDLLADAVWHGSVYVCGTLNVDVLRTCIVMSGQQLKAPMQCWMACQLALMKSQPHQSMVLQQV